MKKPALKELANAVRSDLKECGTIQIWGGDVVRPNDEIFDIVHVAATGPALELKLSWGPPESKREEILRIDDPGEVEVSKGSLIIKYASHIRWAGGDFPPHAGSSDPALLLR